MQLQLGKWLEIVKMSCKEWFNDLTESIIPFKLEFMENPSVVSSRA